MHLIPAYGRDYKSAAAVIADLKAGKDFLLADAPRPIPVNLEQMKPFDFPVQVRYDGLRKVTIIKEGEVR